MIAIDCSPLSVAQTAAYNRGAVSSGRCIVRKGDASALPLSPETCDPAVAFETIYFWPGLERCFAEVAKVLKTGGRFLIVNESDGMDPASLWFEKIIDGMKLYRTREIETALKMAGFP